MRTVRTVAQLRAAVTAWRKAGETIGFVPTMGALHAGHLSLLTAARAGAGRSLVSIFVNPRQFGAGEDLARYPRLEEADAALLAEAGCDLLFAPAADEMYPEGASTTVSVGRLGTVLEGAFRPGHFDGVATVVTRLLTLVGPDLALFGEKDWQQLAVIRRLVTDLGLGVAVRGLPTVREADGLALSSRNLLLGPAEREAAPALYAALTGAAGAIAGGAAAGPVLAAARAAVEAAGFRVDYLVLADPETLEPVDTAPGRLLAAAWLGSVRLIDTLAVEG